jgi:hypothetical protein
MNSSRESIYTALLALFTSVTGITNVSRKFVPWSKLQPEQMPYLMQIEKKENAFSPGRGIPNKWTLTVDVLVYLPSVADTDTQNIYQNMNPLLDAIEASFGDPTVNPPQTLGGLVSQARIQGAVEKGTDALGNVAWFIVPIEIIVPS